MDLEIRSATIADLESIVRLQRLAYAAEARRYDDWSIPPLTQTLDALTVEFGSACSQESIRLYESLGYHPLRKQELSASVTLLYMEKSGVGVQNEGATSARRVD